MSEKFYKVVSIHNGKLYSLMAHDSLMLPWSNVRYPVKAWAYPSIGKLLVFGSIQKAWNFSLHYSRPLEVWECECRNWCDMDVSAPLPVMWDRDRLTEWWKNFMLWRSVASGGYAWAMSQDEQMDDVFCCDAVRLTKRIASDRKEQELMDWRSHVK